MKAVRSRRRVAFDPSALSDFKFQYALVVQRTERDSAKVEAASSNLAESSSSSFKHFLSSLRHFFVRRSFEMEGECARARSLFRKQDDGIGHWRSSRPPSTFSCLIMIFCLIMEGKHVRDTWLAC